MVEVENHIVSFNRTSYQSDSLIVPHLDEINSVEDIDLSEYRSLESAECSCGKYFEDFKGGLRHLSEVRSLVEDSEGDENE